MSSRKLPTDAFDAYYALGPGRNYEAVAKKYSTSKRTVVTLAKREGWQQKIVTLERTAREKADQKTMETIEAMHTRHLKTLQVVLGKALETLRSQPLETAMEAVRAIDMVIKQERAIREEPKQSDALKIETTIKREYELLMVRVEDSDGLEEPSTHAVQ